MNLDETKELGWDWHDWNRRSTRTGGGIVHFANLTRGVKCAPRDAHLCRIQSTHCEGKQWERLLMTVPDDLIARAALGQFIIVHDYSERPRETRAMWQGLSLIRIMMEFRWFGELRSRYPTTGRLGRSGIQYLRNVASSAPKHVKSRFDYFRDLTIESGTTFTRLTSCWRANGGRNCEYQRPAVPTPWEELGAPL